MRLTWRWRRPGRSALGLEACAVIGRDALDLDAMGFKEVQGVKQKLQAGAPRFMGKFPNGPGVSCRQ